ncbi:hypothetical protein PATA110616_14915 [Paenibacillus tarimensis]
MYLGRGADGKSNVRFIELKGMFRGVITTYGKSLFLTCVRLDPSYLSGFLTNAHSFAGFHVLDRLDDWMCGGQLTLESVYGHTGTEAAIYAPFKSIILHYPTWLSRQVLEK